ncbi:DegT/DnrJ/EryC1/StrS family aminotransferase [Halorussus caseinilyticus]|uniref:DegT/DnrJ/EryC1/StrS family aminotransferase n=1 Tax=Halorussus caseinilyticus TaxID=3034025 RepID=A0ABD5WP80_9EURY|nr:DegT/DnrJ/EryC1/StrS family aminotransferase [Halorussus sp. DT72]
MPTVPFLDFSREYDEIGSEMLAAAETVLSSGDYILGNQVEAFERDFAEYVDADHGIGVNSGSDALNLALDAVDIEAGDEVILPAHTFVSTADAVVHNGGIPVFVDIDPETYTIDPSSVERNLTEDTAAIIAVHLYGQPADMDPLLELAREHDLAIVEDASQAHGATYKNRPVGDIGDVGCFSLYPTKNLGAYGDAGIAVTSDDELAEYLRMAREYGSPRKYRYEFVGSNSRLDEFQAAFLDEKLEYLDEFNQRRRDCAAQYDSLLESVVTPTVADDVSHVYHLYVVQTPHRDALREHLSESGVQTLIHYPTPIHQQPAYEDIGRTGDLSVTERTADRILSLPMHPWCRSDEIEYIAALIEEFEA